MNTIYTLLFREMHGGEGAWSRATLWGCSGAAREGEAGPESQDCGAGPSPRGGILLSPLCSTAGPVQPAPEPPVPGHTRGEQYLLWKGEQLLSKILIVAVRLKYLLRVENSDVSMKSLMIKSSQLPQWPESTSSGSLDALSPKEHEK